MRKELGWYITTELTKARRMRRLHIAPDFLLELCKSKGRRTFEVTANALPDDARCVGAYYEPMYARWELYLTSETFDEVDPSVELPVLDSPLWHEIYDPTPTTGDGR